jgi:methanogenic corrinoid protein MtbC1
VIIGGPSGDQHSLPGAIIADLLRGQGFEVIDLGPNTPAESFAETAQQVPRLVAVVIGVTAPGLDDVARASVGAVHAVGLGAPVLAGGSAITGVEHARDLGADAWTGPDGRSVLAAVDGVAARSRTGAAG